MVSFSSLVERIILSQRKLLNGDTNQFVLETSKDQSYVRVFNVQSEFLVWSEKLRAVFINQFPSLALLLRRVPVSVVTSAGEGRGPHCWQHSVIVAGGVMWPKVERRSISEKSRIPERNTGFRIRSKHWCVINVWRLWIFPYNYNFLSAGPRVFELICVIVQSLLYKIVYVSQVSLIANALQS